MKLLLILFAVFPIFGHFVLAEPIVDLNSDQRIVLKASGTVVSDEEVDPKPKDTTKANNKAKKRKRPQVRVVPKIFYSIISKDSGNCIAISNTEKHSGALAIEWTSRLAEEQQWQLVQAHGSWFHLIARHSNLVLSLSADGEYVVQSSESDDTKSHWKLMPDSDGYFRLVNRVGDQYIEISGNQGLHGSILILRSKTDTDRQKWKLQVADIVYEKEDLSKSLAIPAKQLIGKKHPETAEELLEFLHGTTWSIRNNSLLGREAYQMTFDKKGTLTLNSGRVSSLKVLGPKSIKLWDYDHASMSDQFNYFRSVNANDVVYYGVLLTK